MLETTIGWYKNFFVCVKIQEKNQMLYYNGNMLYVNNRTLLQKSLEIKGQKAFLIKGLI